MELILITLGPIVLLVAGILLIKRRARGRKYLISGIISLILFALSLPFFLIGFGLILLLVTGGSFGG